MDRLEESAGFRRRQEEAKGWAGFPAASSPPPPPPRYLSKSVSSSPPLSGQSLLRHSPAPKDRPEKSSWRSGGPSQGQSSPQRRVTVTAAACSAAMSFQCSVPLGLTALGECQLSAWFLRLLTSPAAITMLNAVVSQRSSSLPELVFPILGGMQRKAGEYLLLSPNTADICDCLVERERKE